MLDPHPDQIDINDIALGLSREGRFSNQGRYFISVAQHSADGAVELLERGETEKAKAFILHDATEGYIKDIIRPLKKELGAPYEEIEDRLSRVIFAKFGVDHSLLAQIKDVDDECGANEAAALFDDHPAAARSNKVMLSWDFLTPEEAHEYYLDVFAEVFA
ncbi:hypothetical protein [Inquilinus limosus]|uniref:hypothetical protein n=1 Tax=Inquilinus limosus TaxID=171674 RepID=UPI0006915846|nr:hypothetical protein [Inquilinus limosus]